MKIKIDLMPENYSGKWAVGFGIVSLLSLIVQFFIALFIGGDTQIIEESTFLSTIAYTLSFIFSFSNMASLFMGIYTVVKYKDWKVFKYLGILYLATFLFFLLGEFLFSH